MDYTLPIVILAISIWSFAWAVIELYRVNAGLRIKWQKITQPARATVSETMQWEEFYLFEIWNTSAIRNIITTIQIEAQPLEKGQSSAVKDCDHMIPLPVDLEPGRYFTLKVSEDRVDECLNENAAFRLLVCDSGGKAV